MQKTRVPFEARTIEKCQVERYEYCGSRHAFVDRGGLASDLGDLKAHSCKPQIWLDAKTPEGEKICVNLFNYFKARFGRVQKSQVTKICDDLINKNIKLKIEGGDGFIEGVYRPKSEIEAAHEVAKNRDTPPRQGLAAPPDDSISQGV